jgi:hypothetical protein
MNNLFFETFNDNSSSQKLTNFVDANDNQERNFLMTALLQNNFPDDCAIKVYECLLSINDFDYNLAVCNHKATTFCTLGGLQKSLITTKFSKDDHALGIHIKKHTGTILYHKRILFHIEPIIKKSKMLDDFFLINLSNASWMQEFVRYVR